MNFISQHDRKYHLQKYWAFLLKHPVCSCYKHRRTKARPTVLNVGARLCWHLDGICLALSVTNSPYVALQIINFHFFSDYGTRTVSSYLLPLFKFWPQLTGPKKLRLKVRVACNITYVVQQDTQLLLWWLNIYSQYVWQLDVFRTYRSIFRSIYKLCADGLVCEDCVLLGAPVR